MATQGPSPALPDPTDPAAREATISYLRDLIADHGKEPGPAPAAVQATAPQRPAPPPEAPERSHEQWVEEGREIALRQLGFSARSAHQLREAMLRRDVPEPAAAEVIERLTRVGLIDDAEYAAMLVRTRQAERGLARRALEVELREKGISAEIAAAALEQISAGDEGQAARQLVRKRVQTMRTLDATRRRNRLYGTLARKGYSADVARAAIDEVLLEERLELY